MNFAVWNVRGLNKSSQPKEVVKFIYANNISLMSFVDTKVKIKNSSQVASSINKSWNWLFNYERHFNGRIWVGWDPTVWIVQPFFKASQSI